MDMVNIHNTIIRSICKYAYIPVRREPSEASEMETQILYGESFTIIEEINKWKRIRIDYDGYEGWIDAKLHTISDKKHIADWTDTPKNIVNTPFAIIHPKDINHQLLITAGSETTEAIDTQTTNIISTARQFLGAPYLWGGRTFFGIDCSGFTQIVFKIHGIYLPRNASQQINFGKTVEFIKDTKENDLAFFGNNEGKITHVGICIDNQNIIHASGCVRIDKLDHHGIYNEERKCYTHKLIVIKRILS